MASSSKTSLGLNQWAESDKPTMKDFNSDNSITDQQLRAKADAANPTLTGTVRAGTYRSNISDATSATTYGDFYCNGNPADTNIVIRGVRDGNTTDWYLKPVDGSFFPSTNGSGRLGGAGSRWSTGYFASDIIVSSDENEKHDIQNLDPNIIEKLFMSLRPVSFKYNNGTSDRTHYGLISQEVEESLISAGLLDKDFGGLIKSPKFDEDGNELSGETYGLRYGEFHAPEILMIQQQQRRIEVQQNQINELLQRVAKLEENAYGD